MFYLLLAHFPENALCPAASVFLILKEDEAVLVQENLQLILMNVYRSKGEAETAQEFCKADLERKDLKVQPNTSHNYLVAVLPDPHQANCQAALYVKHAMIVMTLGEREGFILLGTYPTRDGAIAYGLGEEANQVVQRALSTRQRILRLSRSGVGLNEFSLGRSAEA